VNVIVHRLMCRGHSGIVTQGDTGYIRAVVRVYDALKGRNLGSCRDGATSVEACALVNAANRPAALGQVAPRRWRPARHRIC